ncbi:MAG: hypothetical protein ACF787_09805 [Rhodopirellula sp. JB053]
MTPLSKKFIVRDAKYRIASEVTCTRSLKMPGNAKLRRGVRRGNPERITIRCIGAAVETF